MLTIEKITEIVCETSNIDADNVRSQKRVTQYAITRYVIMKIARANKHKLKDIGTYLGGRDHATVMRGIAELDTALSYANNLDVLYYAVKRKYKLMIDCYEQCKFLMPITYKIKPLTAPKLVSVRINKAKVLELELIVNELKKQA